MLEAVANEIDSVIYIGGIRDGHEHWDRDLVKADPVICGKEIDAGARVCGLQGDGYAKDDVCGLSQRIRSERDGNRAVIGGAGETLELEVDGGGGGAEPQIDTDKRG